MSPEENAYIAGIIDGDDSAISLLKEIEPYLVIKNKKKRAKLIIDRYKDVTPRNGRYSASMLIAKEQFYTEFINIK